jgi:hypothetical protein
LKYLRPKFYEVFDPVWCDAALGYLRGSYTPIPAAHNSPNFSKLSQKSSYFAPQVF